MKTRKGLGKGLGQGYKNIAPMDSHIHSLSAKGVKTFNNIKLKSIPTVTKDKPFKTIINYKRGDGSKAKLKVKIEKIGKAKKGNFRYKRENKNDEYSLEYEGHGFGSFTTGKTPKNALKEVDRFIEQTKGVSEAKAKKIFKILDDDYYREINNATYEIQKLASDPKNAGGTCILSQGVEIVMNGTLIWKIPYNCYQSDMSDETLKPVMDKLEKELNKDKRLKGIKVYHNQGRMD